MTPERHTIAAPSAAALPVRIADLVPGMHARGVFVVKKKVCREQPGGHRFLLFQFADRSGQINGVLWDGIDDVSNGIAAGDLAHVQGDVQTYQNARQIKVQRIVPAEPGGFDLADFLPTSSQDLEALYQRLLAAVHAVRNPWLRRLYSEIFQDPEVARRFKHAPAGKGWHHAYVGGLLEHVLSMLEIASLILRQHPEADGDLVVGGVLLHDIGKIEELVLRSHIDYSDAGRLVGHLVQGCLLVGRHMDRIEGFPADARMRVLHMLVSHHGAVERGSPKPPMTLEATIVHLVDHLDSQVDAVARVVGGPRNADGWTEHVKLQDRSYYAGRPSAASDGSND